MAGVNVPLAALVHANLCNVSTSNIVWSATINSCQTAAPASSLSSIQFEKAVGAPLTLIAGQSERSNCLLRR